MAGKRVGACGSLAQRMHRRSKWLAGCHSIDKLLNVYYRRRIPCNNMRHPHNDLRCRNLEAEGEGWHHRSGSNPGGDHNH